MKLTKITPNDTGVVALVEWDAEGVVTKGEMPNGLGARQKGGGIYIRRRGSRVELHVMNAVALHTAPTIPIPSEYSATSDTWETIQASTYSPRKMVYADAGAGHLTIRGGLSEGDVLGSYQYRTVFRWETSTFFPTPDR